MKSPDVIATILLVVGGSSWGLTGLLDNSLDSPLLGAASSLTATVYALAGLSAVWHALQWKANQRHWTTAPSRA